MAPSKLDVDVDSVDDGSSCHTADIHHDFLPYDAKPSSEEPQGPAPTVKLLFSLLSRRQCLLLLLPAFLTSIIAGGIAPFMTYVVGQTFDAFAHFPITPNPPQEAKDRLLKEVGKAALQLLGLGIGSFVLGSINSSLWIWTGERNTMALRKKVYVSVAAKDMNWFDTNMNTESDVEAHLGAGGMMAKFTRETDEVRMASSLAAGMLVQYMVTVITCLILGFIRSWALTLVILSTVPILVIVQSVSQRIVGPLLAVDRGESAEAATLVDRAVSAIATVKAFNAAAFEQNSFGRLLKRMTKTTAKLNAAWASTSGMSQFISMNMFVQGFWFGSKLVREGKINAGDVMAVFWACLIATSNLQMCIPQLITFTKGKFAMASLLAACGPSSSPSPSAPLPLHKHLPPRSLRKIIPKRFEGEVALNNVSFAYPSRPTVKVLSDVSLFLPARETTFIVGGSGSGKSTISQLLLRLYHAESGFVSFDEQDITYLDEHWIRDQVGSVDQNCILFDMSVYDNVAIGARGRAVQREEVISACRAALIHDFIVCELPQGYETPLGSGGKSLSGGQKQRIAIARALLRDPNVLILDEATSALDVTTRGLVFEAIKRWRLNKTTIVITHDLSQIEPSDFVYVLKNGEVVEQGYCLDLASSSGELRSMMDAQGQTGGYLPAKSLDEDDEVEKSLEDEKDTNTARLAGKHASMATANALGPVTLSNWMFDVVADLTRTTTAPAPAALTHSEPHRISRFVPTEPFPSNDTPRPRKRSSIQELPSLHLRSPSPAFTVSTRRFSLQFTPSSPTFTFHQSWPVINESNETVDDEKAMLITKEVMANRPTKMRRNRWDAAAMPMEVPQIDVEAQPEHPPQLSFLRLMRAVYPTIPYKPVVALGLFICVASGAMTPIFSFLLSRLLYEVSIGASNVKLINQYGGIVLGAAALDGLLLGAKFFTMESAGMAWLQRIRAIAFSRVLAQDKKWFDKAENSAIRMVQVIVKDGDDARDLISSVFGQFAVVFAMLTVGLLWALVSGWQLTLVGFAIAPVFAIAMAVQTNLVSKCELRNKRAREEVAKGYYETVNNIRSIRAMSFEPIFQKQFDKAADAALSTGVKGAFVEGCTLGIASGLIYMAEALLFFVGAVLVARGTYTYLQMVQVLNLVVFTVSIGSQLMSFTERIAKAVQATRDFNEVLQLSTDSDESRGVRKPTIQGPVSFHNVSFSYPERKDAPVLRNITLTIQPGESIALVGASGSGKSTIASLLQRLYEPSSGVVTIGDHALCGMDSQYLRENVSIVSQNPYLFDATIAENIAYGNASITIDDVHRAAKEANVHSFITSLPNGYDTMVGENATLMSGGQAQRISIARALARPSKILILDECTSALDPENQKIILDTIHRVQQAGKTVIMVTHKLQAMQSCERIAVLDNGRIAEEGSFESLMARKGVFAKLAQGGEWSSD